MRSRTKKASSKSLVLAFSNWGFSWGGVLDNRKGEWWLIGQVLLIAAHLLPAWSPFKDSEIIWPTWLTIVGTCLLIIGIIKSAKAFISLGPNLSPLPNPKAGSKLVQTGSYKFCRHPLYQGIIISSLGIVISVGSIFHALLSFSLTVLLIKKAKREELLLIHKHLNYKNYLESTPAIIKGIPLLDWRN